MVRVGLISDTHGYVDPLIWKFLGDCDEIWHAGDFGGMDVVQKLRDRLPLKGVYGNIDDAAVRAEFPEHLRFRCEEVSVWMTHIGGRPGRYAKGVRQQLQADPPGIFVCGHSHILQVTRDRSVGGMLFLNPGAAGHQGFHASRTVLRFEINGPEVVKMQAVQLGPRGRTPRKQAEL